MKKIIPLIFSVLYALNSNAQAVGGWGTCEFATVATMNAFDPSTNAYDCKKVFVQATNEHYYWNGTIWVLVQDTDTDDQNASEVPFTPVGTIVATDVQAAIAEIEPDIYGSVGVHSDVDITTIAPSNGDVLTWNGTNFAPSANALDNIYNTDDDLTGNRTVGLDGNSLTFDGPSTSDVTIQSDGDVGIGVTPTTDFDVKGTGLFRNGSDWSGGGSGATGQLQFGFNGTDTYRHAIKSRHNNGNDNYNGLDFFVWGIGQDINDLATSRVMTISAQNSGSVGIGTGAPTAKLDVRDGNVRFDAYGLGTYDDASPERLLGVDSDGYIVEVDLAADGLQDNIYNIDDDLTGDRVVGMDGNSLTFDGTSDVIIEADGDVGIGVPVPSTELDVDGIALFRNGSDWNNSGNNGQIQFGFNSTDTYRHSIKSRHINSADYNGIDFFVWEHGVDGVNDLGSLQVMSVTGRNSGSVGIGTLNPNAKFEVNGGNVRFSDYGSGTYTGTLSRILGVEADGDIIEVDASTLGTDDQTASEVNITDAGGNFSSTNVEGALAELANATDENIYNTNGTIDANREVTLGNFDIEFNSTGLGDFFVSDNGTIVFAVEDDHVGIGVASPTKPLHIFETTGTPASATNGTIFLEKGNSGGSQSIVFESNINAGSDYAYIEYSDNGSGNGSSSENALLVIGIENDIPGTYQDDIAIMPSGYLGVGTTSPNAFFDVAGGQVRFSNYGTSTTYDDASPLKILGVQSDGDVVQIATSSIIGTDDQNSSEVPFTPVGTIAATDVQAAIAEIEPDIYGSVGVHSDIDITTTAPSNGDVLSWDGTNFVPSAGGGASTNIYTDDGTLEENRTVTMDGNDLTFDSGSNSNFTIDGFSGSTFSNPIFQVDRNADRDFRFFHSDDTDNGYWTLGTNDGVALEVDNTDGEGIYLEYTGDVGIGTSTPDRKLDVEGGQVRFSDYGDGTYEDTTAVYLLGVEADGDLIEMNTAKNSRIFYPPAIAIVADDVDTGFELDLHQTYVDLFEGSDPSFVKSTSAPGAIPTYDQDELYYYILNYDTDVFENVTIDNNGLMVYDVKEVASDNCSFINVVFVVKEP